MKDLIVVRECTTPAQEQRFWTELNCYFARDIYPQQPDERPGADYRAEIARLHRRSIDPVRYILFERDGKEIGLALTVVYAAEDGKQFILEFCVYPQQRGGGTGKACAAALLAWGRTQGALYAELNCDTPRRQRFWAADGFVPNGRDRWGVPLMLLPPQQRLPFAAERLTDAEPVLGLEQSFRASVGEPMLTQEQCRRLAKAVQRGDIVFFAAKRLERPVGICSVSLHWSSYDCAATAVFEDFYIEPAFRGQGVARLLVEQVRAWCAGQECTCVTVACAVCDLPMYRKLGFTVRLGNLLAMRPGE